MCFAIREGIIPLHTAALSPGVGQFGATSRCFLIFSPSALQWCGFPSTLWGRSIERLSPVRSHRCAPGARRAGAGRAAAAAGRRPLGGHAAGRGQGAQRRALSPTLSQLSVAGLVGVPSLMAGQLLGGTPPVQVGGPNPSPHSCMRLSASRSQRRCTAHALRPSVELESAPIQAARYQIVAMLLAAAGAALASSAAVLAAVNAVVDGDHQVRGERLAPRAPGSAGVANWVQAQCGKVRCWWVRAVPLTSQASGHHASWVLQLSQGRLTYSLSMWVPGVEGVLIVAWLATC